MPSATCLRTGLPSNVTVPAVGSCRPASTSRNVDLPQPDGPTTAKNSPLRRSRSIGPSALTGGWLPAPGKTRVTAASCAWISRGAAFILFLQVAGQERGVDHLGKIGVL